jgi:hypothetical protein
MTKKTAKLPTFDLIENEKSLELQEKLAQQVTQAQALVNALDYRYGEEVRAAVIENKENAELLDELSAQLDKAKRDLDRAKRMQQVGNNVNSRTVSKQDIENGLRAYQNMYQTEVIKPSEKELRKAKEAYIAAFLEHDRKIRFFDEQARAAYLAVNPSAISIPYGVGFGTIQNVSHKCITSDDLRVLEQGQQPSSLKPMMKLVEDENGHSHYVPVDEEGENN